MRGATGIILLALSTLATLAFGFSGGSWCSSPEATLWLIDLTDSGGWPWVLPLLLTVLAVLLLDGAIRWRQRSRETLALLVLLGISLPVVSLLNENVLKTAVSAPRPSHVALHRAGLLPEPGRFYDLTPRAQGELLEPLETERMRREIARRVRIPETVVKVWLHETSSTFPSGHAVNAFLALGLIVLCVCRKWTVTRSSVTAVLAVWAIGVSWSRVLLGVHRPWDVLAGAFLGILLSGLMYWVMRCRWLQRFRTAA